MFQIKRINLLVFIFITIILIVFDVYKAAHASFTIDESDTYLHWVNSPFMDIISYKLAGTNNHILNTLLMKLFQALFGTSELVLRLPNIIAHIFYLVFSFKIFNRYTKSSAILFFILINANPFLVDFFSLARGYGIAIALMMGGFYFYCRYIENQKTKHHFLTLLLLCFAALANFALISLVLVFIFTHNLFQFFIFKRKFSFKYLWQINYLNGIFLFLLVAVCYEPIRKIIQLKLLYFGGLNGFWEDTVGSITETFSYFSPHQSLIMTGGKILVIFLSVLFIIRCIMYILSKNYISLTQKFVLFFGSSLFLIVLVSILQHLFLNTPFMMERFALFLYPIFILMGSFLVVDILEYSYQYITRGILVLLTALFFWHTCYSLNASWYYKWKCESTSKDMITDLLKIKQREPSTKITLGAYWNFFSSLEFYVKIWKLDWITMDYTQAEMQKNEYFYFVSDDFNQLHREQWEVIHHYQPANNYLAKYVKEPRFKISVQLKAANGKFLYANSNKNEQIIADRDQIDSSKVFILLRFEKDQCAVYCHNMKFLSVGIEQQAEIAANRDRIAERETFTLMELDNNFVAFKTINGKYLSLDKTSQQIFANSNAIEKNEKFKLILINR